MNKITRFLSLCCAAAVLAGVSGAGVLSAKASTDNGRQQRQRQRRRQKQQYRKNRRRQNLHTFMSAPFPAIRL